MIVKGSEYTPDQVVGREVVEMRGGRVEIFPRLPGRSTSEIAARLRSASEPPS